MVPASQILTSQHAARRKGHHIKDTGVMEITHTHTYIYIYNTYNPFNYVYVIYIIIIYIYIYIIRILNYTLYIIIQIYIYISISVCRNVYRYINQNIDIDYYILNTHMYRVVFFLFLFSIHV